MIYLPPKPIFYCIVLFEKCGNAKEFNGRTANLVLNLNSKLNGLTFINYNSILTNYNVRISFLHMLQTTLQVARCGPGLSTCGNTLTPL